MFLTIIGEVSHKGRVVWLCRCICGRETKVRKDTFGKKVFSCGCQRSSLMKKHRSENGVDSAFNRLLLIYRTGARSRDLEFLLSPEEFRTITSGTCFYCGVLPSKVICRGEKKYVYNGIDRRDNRLGYSQENCVSCCEFCNSLKSNHDVDVFLSQVKKIARRHET